MSDETPKVVVNGQEVPPSKKLRLRDLGLDSDELVKQAREKSEPKK